MSLLRPLSTLSKVAAATTTKVRVSNMVHFTTNSHTSTILLPTNTTTTTASTTYRSKHSATQVKRLFKNNPARLRLLKKNGNHPSSLKKQQQAQIPIRKYPDIYKPTFLGNGWSAPPNPDEIELPQYPFRIARTGRKPFGTVGFLPVYRDVR